MRVLLAESDVRDKKINELAAKLHSAEQQQKAAMQTVNFIKIHDHSCWCLFRPQTSLQAHMMHQRLEMVFRQNEARIPLCSIFENDIIC